MKESEGRQQPSCREEHTYRVTAEKFTNNSETGNNCATSHTSRSHGCTVMSASVFLSTTTAQVPTLCFFGSTALREGPQRLTTPLLLPSCTYAYVLKLTLVVKLRVL